MKLSFVQRVDFGARAFVPVAVSLLLVLLSVVPLGIPGYGVMAPLFSLMAVYYWSIHRPDLLPNFAVFGIGLLQDILSGLPLGVLALVFLLVRAVVVSQRRFLLGKSFLLVWWGFALVVAGASFAIWLLVCVLERSLIDLRPAFFQAVMTLATFPFLTWLFARAQRAYLRPV